MGAEDRYEDWLYLDLIQREWLCPASGAAEGMLKHKQVSERASVVLLFWTYFESRVERIVRLGLAQMSEALRDDLLARYSSVGARMDRLYKLAFGTTYFADLRAVDAEPIVSLNAVAESFFQLLKRERIRRQVYSTRNDARADVFNYIEMFYNPKRRHGTAGDTSPVEFERRQSQRLTGV